jgi:hypothetical protein
MGSTSDILFDLARMYALEAQLLRASRKVSSTPWNSSREADKAFLRALNAFRQLDLARPTLQQTAAIARQIAQDPCLTELEPAEQSLLRRLAGNWTSRSRP